MLTVLLNSDQTRLTGFILVLLIATIGLLGLVFLWAIFAVWRRYNAYHRPRRREPPAEMPDAWQAAGQRLTADDEPEPEDDGDDRDV